MNILLVEDDMQLREVIADTLMMKGHEVTEAGNGVEALVAVQKQTPDLVLSDINMPDMDGLQLLEHLKVNHPWLPIILMTAYGDVGQAVKAMQQGANDYLMKPFEIEELDKILKPFTEHSVTTESDEEPIAESTAARQIFQLAERVAMTDSTVLISGESGTGKEVLARYIHQHSLRKHEPFVAINCAAIPENMLEAILFGYEKGAFTGAYNAMPGKFEQANGGTILLDEISEMEIGLQAKLLRVLQERQVERLGGKKTIDLDVRVVATTNRELGDYVADGHFREDLYYRLSVFPLNWLPLRNRSADILPLAKRILNHHAQKMKRPTPAMSDDAQKKLISHPWPGNVRELDNTMQRALIVQSNPLLTANDFILTPIPKNRNIAATVVETTIDDGELGNDLKNREVELIVRALKEEPSRKEAADRLGISPRTLRYKMARLRDEGIDVESMLTA